MERHSLLSSMQSGPKGFITRSVRMLKMLLHMDVGGRKIQFEFKTKEDTEDHLGTAASIRRGLDGIVLAAGAQCSVVASHAPVATIATKATTSTTSSTPLTIAVDGGVRLNNKSPALHPPKICIIDTSMQKQVGGRESDLSVIINAQIDSMIACLLLYCCRPVPSPFLPLVSICIYVFGCMAWALRPCLAPRIDAMGRVWQASKGRFGLKSTLRKNQRMRWLLTS